MPNTFDRLGLRSASELPEAPYNVQYSEVEAGTIHIQWMNVQDYLIPLIIQQRKYDGSIFYWVNISGDLSSTTTEFTATNVTEQQFVFRVCIDDRETGVFVQSEIASFTSDFNVLTFNVSNWGLGEITQIWEYDGIKEIITPTQDVAFDNQSQLLSISEEVYLQGYVDVTLNIGHMGLGLQPTRITVTGGNWTIDVPEITYVENDYFYVDWEDTMPTGWFNGIATNKPDWRRHFAFWNGTNYQGMTKTYYVVLSGGETVVSDYEEVWLKDDPTIEGYKRLYLYTVLYTGQTITIDGVAYEAININDETMSFDLNQIEEPAETDLAAPSSGETRYTLHNVFEDKADYVLEGNWTMPGNVGSNWGFHYVPLIEGTFRATSDEFDIYEAQKILLSGNAGNISGYQGAVIDAVRIIFVDVVNTTEYVFQELTNITTLQQFVIPLVWNVPVGFGTKMKVVFEFEGVADNINNCYVGNTIQFEANVLESLIPEPPEPEVEGLALESVAVDPNYVYGDMEISWVNPNNTGQIGIVLIRGGVDEVLYEKIDWSETGLTITGITEGFYDIYVRPLDVNGNMYSPINQVTLYDVFFRDYPLDRHIIIFADNDKPTTGYVEIREIWDEVLGVEMDVFAWSGVCNTNEIINTGIPSFLEDATFSRNFIIRYYAGLTTTGETVTFEVAMAAYQNIELFGPEGYVPSSLEQRFSLFHYDDSVQFISTNFPYADEHIYTKRWNGDNIVTFLLDPRFILVRNTGLKESNAYFAVADVEIKYHSTYSTYSNQIFRDTNTIEYNNDYTYSFGTGYTESQLSGITLSGDDGRYLIFDEIENEMKLLMPNTNTNYLAIDGVDYSLEWNGSAWVLTELPAGNLTATRTNYDTSYDVLALTDTWFNLYGDTMSGSYIGTFVNDEYAFDNTYDDYVSFGLEDKLMIPISTAIGDTVYGMVDKDGEGTITNTIIIV